MAKLTAWVATILGVLLLLPLLGIPGTSVTEGWVAWLIALGVFVIGVGKLVRNYSGKRR